MDLGKVYCKHGRSVGVPQELEESRMKKELFFFIVVLGGVLAVVSASFAQPYRGRR